VAGRPYDGRQHQDIKSSAVQIGQFRTYITTPADHRGGRYARDDLTTSHRTHHRAGSGWVQSSPGRRPARNLWLLQLRLGIQLSTIHGPWTMAMTTARGGRSQFTVRSSLGPRVVIPQRSCCTITCTES
jgi:hypothetical protein